MFITLLAVTFAIAVVVTTIVARVFRSAINGILNRIFISEIAAAWQRYMTFAIYVVGISGGVRIWDLESTLHRNRGSLRLSTSIAIGGC